MCLSKENLSLEKRQDPSAHVCEVSGASVQRNHFNSLPFFFPGARMSFDTPWKCKKRGAWQSKHLYVNQWEKKRFSVDWTEFVFLLFHDLATFFCFVYERVILRHPCPRGHLTTQCYKAFCLWLFAKFLEPVSKRQGEIFSTHCHRSARNNPWADPACPQVCRKHWCERGTHRQVLALSVQCDAGRKATPGSFHLCTPGDTVQQNSPQSSHLRPRASKDDGKKCRTYQQVLERNEEFCDGSIGEKKCFFCLLNYFLPFRFLSEYLPRYSVHWPGGLYRMSHAVACAICSISIKVFSIALLEQL